MKKLTAWCSLWTIVWGVGLAALSCHNVTPGVTPAPPVVTDQSQCQAACDNLKVLGCAEANPIDMGTQCKHDADCVGPDGKPDVYQSCAANGACIISCVNFCTSTEKNGVWLDPTCVALIVTCDQIESCPAPAPRPGTSCTGSSCKVAPGGHGK